MLDCSNAQFDLAEPGSPLLYGPGASVVQNGQTCGRDGLSFSVLRPPGRYRAIVSVPPAHNAVSTQEFDVNGPLNIALDVTTGTVTGAITVNGAALTVSCVNATVRLRGAQSRIAIDVPVSCAGTGWKFSTVAASTRTRRAFVREPLPCPTVRARYWQRSPSPRAPRLAWHWIFHRSRFPAS